MCLGHDPSSPGIENQGHWTRPKVIIRDDCWLMDVIVHYQLRDGAGRLAAYLSNYCILQVSAADTGRHLRSSNCHSALHPSLVAKSRTSALSGVTLCDPVMTWFPVAVRQATDCYRLYNPFTSTAYRVFLSELEGRNKLIYPIGLSRKYSSY